MVIFVLIWLYFYNVVILGCQWQHIMNIRVNKDIIEESSKSMYKIVLYECSIV